MDTRYLAYIRSGTASGGGPMSMVGPIGAEMAVSGGSFVIIR
jgi:hypothetical protein